MTGGSARGGGSSLEPVREAFEEFARDDPMYAALTRGGRENNRWDPAEFFEDGRQEIRDVLLYLGSLGVEPARGRALDFGCAVGRLTQALGDHFEEAVGVDIAAAMLEAARRHDRHEGRVTYVHNTRPDLALLETASFDFVYTNKVLQHIPPGPQAAYIREFVRVLRPGGVAVFQLRNGPRIRPGSLRAWLYTLNRRHFRRLAQRVRGRRPYEMHYLARATVEEAVSGAGGRIVDVVDLSRARPNKSLRYCAVKD
ncbi:MAG TPA: class I SAM-dependent methyltransferase [Longimicrobiales bacterium]|nr:class I SAM-dependent methyltransferase [Longimicrobiales bacterium]